MAALSALLLLLGCQAQAPRDEIELMPAEPINLEAEIASIREAAATDSVMLASTVAAASTQVAENSLRNAALGATLQAAYTATPEVRAVVVSAEDMGSSLEQEMMDDMPGAESSSSAVQVLELDTALDVNANTGCTTGSVKRFGGNENRIYATARVRNLQEDTYFEMDWIFQNRVLSRLSWLSDYAAATECVWFYVTTDDFPFLPGTYTATLFVNGISQASTDFAIDG